MKLSVIMLTYKHEKFIREAIEGVLMQITDFDFELILLNDDSPDNSDFIIQDILQTHSKSHKINYTKHSKNMGMMLNLKYGFLKSKSEYIAVCEGDDYWIDPFKLQKQVNFLDNNPDYVLTFHKVKILKTNGDFVEDFITKVPENYEIIETIAEKGNYIHTPSIVYRNIIKNFPFEFEITPIGDFFLYLMLAEHGKVKYFDEIMCVYRHGVGIMSRQDELNLIKNNLKTFTCLLSYLKDEKIKKIIFERHSKAVLKLENYYINKNDKAFVLDSYFFKGLKYILVNYKNPRNITKRIKAKLKLNHF